MNHYYCDDTFWLGLNRDAVEKMFSSIDKSFYKITMFYRHDDCDNFVFNFKDSDIDKECNYKVGISTFDDDPELFAAEAQSRPDALAAFPLELTLSAKQFKKTVTDAHQYSDTLTVEKLGTYPFQFTYTRVGVVYHEVYRAPTKVCLRSSIHNGDIFRCVVSVANVKSLASAMVTDPVRIFCREDDDILFRSEIDSLSMSTFMSLA
jgi:hypothetical protein